MNRLNPGRPRTALALLLAAAVLAGCASTAPNYEARFGEAVRANRQAQVLHPTAGANPAPALGMDGAASQEAVQRYVESFKAPPPVVNVINIGGGQ